MARQKHEQRLGQGVDGWNRWRETNPEVKPNLRGIPWLLIMDLTLQSGVIWKDIRYDPPQRP